MIYPVLKLPLQIHVLQHIVLDMSLKSGTTVHKKYLPQSRQKLRFSAADDLRQGVDLIIKVDYDDEIFQYCAVLIKAYGTQFLPD